MQKDSALLLVVIKENSSKKATGFNSTYLHNIPAKKPLEIPLKTGLSQILVTERQANSIPQRPMSTLETGFSDTNFSMFFGEGDGTVDWTFFRKPSTVGHKTGILFKAADHVS